MEKRLAELLPDKTLRVWNALISEVDLRYDVDKLWREGLRDWDIEYKYRRGGKTLCTFYARKDSANILIVYGRAEREKFEALRGTISQSIQNIYDAAEALHDGKWLLIPLDETTVITDIIAMLKLKRKPNRKS